MKSKQYKVAARTALSGNWVTAVLVTIVASALGGTTTGLMPLFKLDYNSYKDSFTKILGDMFNLFTSGSSIWSWVVFILGSVTSVGVAKFYLNIITGRVGDVSDVFSYFKIIIRALVTKFFKMFFVILWSLLLIVPGIIAAYSYSMTSYILAENPGIDPLKALGKSKAIMKGNKLRLFKLHLSFIGWLILCVFTLGLATFYVTPFMSAATAAFYKDVSKQSPLI